MKRVFQVVLQFLKKIGLKVSFFLGFHLDLNRLDVPKEEDETVQIKESADKDKNKTEKGN